MKLVMDERLKHRLIGLAVIISLGAIFAPAVVRKSTQKMENNFSVNIKLPPKPVLPHVAVTQEKDMFKTIKVARIPAHGVNKSTKVLAPAHPAEPHYESHITKIQTDIHPEALVEALNEAAQTSAKETVVLDQVAKAAKTAAIAHKPVKPKPSVVAKNYPKPQVIKNVYALQIASFSLQSNAQALVNKLQSRGYKASYTKISSKQGTIFKVYAGQSPNRNEVMKLKMQLAGSMQLNGFIVNTGVS